MSLEPLPTPSRDEAFLAVLDILVETGTEVAREIAAADIPVTEKANAYERIARSVRRAILLSRHITENPLRPDQSAAILAALRAAAARKAEREAERAAASPAAPRPPPAYQADRNDRLETIAADQAFLRGPIEQVFLGICTDMGIAASTVLPDVAAAFGEPPVPPTDGTEKQIAFRQDLQTHTARPIQKIPHRPAPIQDG